MRIVFVVAQPGNGGSERAALNLVNYLASKGHDIHVVFLLKSDIEYPLSENVHTHYIKQNSSRFMGEIVRAIDFKRMIKEIKPERIVALFSGFNTIYFSGCMNKYRTVLSERMAPSVTLSNPIKRFHRTNIYRKASYMVFQTEDAQSFFSIDIQKKSQIIGNPLNSNLPLPYHGVREKRIVGIGRLENQKNFRLLIEAFSIAHKIYPDYTLEIYGRGSLQTALEQQIMDLGLSGAVKLKDFSKTIHQDIIKSAIYVSSSNFEGVSNAMLEALAIGLPSICTDCPDGGARMYIKPYENGLLVPVNDTESLSNAIIELLSKPELSEKFSSNSIKIND